MKYTEIKSQQDACKVLNREVKPGQELKDIADAINFLDEDYKPKKGGWYPLFWWDDAGGFGFSDSGLDRWNTHTTAGARLAYRFRSPEVSEYFATEFLPLHKELFYS
jgi:hypothetical protein